ncbi:flagellar motor stator protein MotA [Salinisphaera hydrothermalis]|uniref:Flagellar motor protein MotA n=1 Tax=Salinisphaera hydrothermalis (strain C41B8) TaxID=1304275 RepID=A0A084IMW6_SALHC|nr:flagellar motor stator protein MotA [Salinisphaera hydrothermalis]KEZ78050.1 flagellar motor protein MotA [Salinisphaera hydrothermalis C41B8]
MLVVAGYIVVMVSVLGGYALVGGHMGVLYQPAEFVIIFGAGIGAFLASTNGKGVSAMIRVFPKLLRGHRYSKSTCLDLMTLLYLLMAKARQQGMMALEADIEDPANSPLFSSYPTLLGDTLIMEFINDYLRLMISGNMDAFEIEALMDHEIETFQQEAEVPAHGLSAMGDGLPAFGIVAAVMGVVHALGSASLEPAGIGPLIAHAMVGTFLGILLAYGFVSPLASRVRTQIDDVVKVLQAIKVTLLAHLNGYAPPLAIEFGRKALFSAERPAFSELENHVREVRAGGTRENP